MINPNSNNWLGASDPIVQYSWDHIKHHCKVSLQRPTSTGLISKRCTREVSNEEERSLSHSGANFIEVPLVSLSPASRQQAARCFPDSELGARDFLLGGAASTCESISRTGYSCLYCTGLQSCVNYLLCL